MTAQSMTKGSFQTVTRLCFALLVGFGFAFLPTLTRNWPESGALSLLGAVIRSLLLPGVIVGMIVSAGNVHLMSQWILDASNVILYSGVSYLILRARAKRGAGVPDSKDGPR
jgi:hypothetical protein